MDPCSTTIGGERMTGAPLVARVSFDPELPDGETGELMLFVTAHGTAAEVLTGCRYGDRVRVAGRLRLARRGADASPGVWFGCVADSVEPGGTPH